MLVEPVLLYIFGILVVVVGLAVSIALHEIGHLVPAKLFGVKVGQYMVGFGATLWSKRRGETEYGIKAIPLGGYISMAGMYPPVESGGRARTSSTGFFQTMVQDAREANADTILVGEEERTFYRLPIYKRMIIMFGGPLMNLLIAVVLFAVVLCGFGVQQVSTTVGSVNQCLLPATSDRQTCETSDPVAPGAAAGMMPGDKIVSANGVPVESWEQATEAIRSSPGQPLSLVVERNGTEAALTVIPHLTERFVAAADGTAAVDASGERITEKTGMLGITAAVESVQQPLTAVIPAVWDNVARVGHLILNLPQRLIDVAQAAFGPEERDPNGPLSVVGVGRIAGEISSIDTIPIADRAATLIGLIGSVNIALFVFNLVPLMPLDGGHIASALWEGIRRFFAKVFKRRDPGPVDATKLIPLTFTVVILLGGMSLLLIYADIVKPISFF